MQSKIKFDISKSIQLFVTLRGSPDKSYIERVEQLVSEETMVDKSPLSISIDDLPSTEKKKSFYKCPRQFMIKDLFINY